MGSEYLEIDGKKSLMKRGGILANQAGSDLDHEDVFTPGKVAYEEAAALVYAARDPHARIQRMDEERIDTSILYPSLGLGLGRESVTIQIWLPPIVGCTTIGSWDFVSPTPTG